jgi:hypothetical protein
VVIFFHFAFFDASYDFPNRPSTILETNLFHLETAIDNKEFQVYPEPKEKSSGSSIWPRDE